MLNGFLCTLPLDFRSDSPFQRDPLTSEPEPASQASTIGHEVHIVSFIAPEPVRVPAT